MPAVDEDGGLHIAALDPTNMDLVYAYLPSDKAKGSPSTSDFKTCVVDSSGIVGDSLTIDVALDANNKAIPTISYYGSSCKRPKIAWLVKTDIQNPEGAVSDYFTGNWECSLIPSAKTLDFSDKNLISVGMFKDADGRIKASPNKVDSEYDNYLISGCVYYGSHWGIKYGNGTSNPVVGYAVKISSSLMHIETAQMK